MPKLDNAILTLNRLARPTSGRMSAIASLAITVAYLAAVLSVPMQEPQIMVWLAIFPVIQAETDGIGFGRLFVQSLWVLPLVVLIGVFNPVYDTATAFYVGTHAVSRGWVSFVSLVLRGLLSMQALLLLTRSAGIYGVCDALRRCGCPKVLVVQLQFTYRYMLVMLEEAQGMDRARKARGFGRTSYPLKMWGRMVGQLLVRSYERAGRIHRAMLSRGFDGTIPVPDTYRQQNRKAAAWTYFIGWLSIIALLRFLPLSDYFTTLISR